jgi:hypothetical protein
MVFQNKHYYWCFVAVVPLLISSDVGVTSFMTETPNFAATRKSMYMPNSIASSQSMSPPTTSSLDLSSYDSEYYTPTEQPAISGNSQSQSRITLSRFLSQYVKDHPEVSVILHWLCCRLAGENCAKKTAQF